MPKLPRVSGKRAIAALERLGFVQVRSRGSHVVMARSRADAGRVVRVVPEHDEIAVGALRGVLRQAGTRISLHWRPRAIGRTPRGRLQPNIATLVMREPRLRLLRGREVSPTQLLVLGAYHPNGGSLNNRIADALFSFISDGATMPKHWLEDLPHFF